ncbi:MAG: PPC domain-containing protein [Planctomycetaceae bacterium]|nr:PPC domain-containing protein [Planctomycetaceae bacterium]
MLPVLAQPLLAAPPKVNYFFPSGGQRGQTATITAAGEFSNWPVQIWSDRPGLSATSEAEKGKLKVTIAADAAPGVYWLRLFGSGGASSLRPFIVGTLPELDEIEPNDSPSKAMPTDAKVTINGRLGKSGDEDCFLMSLTKGQTLVASLQANSVLASPLDAVLQICETSPRTDSLTQQTVTEAYVAAQNHDAIGLDPQIAFTARKDGPHLLRLFAFPSEPNSTIGFAGGETYVYRLTLTTGGFVDHVLPLALSKDAAQAQLAGWNLPQPAIIDVPPGGDEAVAWLFRPDAAGVWPAPRGGYAAVVAAENSAPSQPHQVQLPVTISGRLESANDTDAFAFSGTKGQKVRVRTAAGSLGFPTDLTIALIDAVGQVVAEQDDAGRDDRDPTLSATIAADGQQRVVVRDLAGRGGLRMVYRLSIDSPEPDFELSLAADSFVLAADKPLEIPLTATGLEGFAESVEIRVLDLPAGVAAEPLNVQATGGASGQESGRRSRRRGGGQAAAPANAKLILKADPAAIQPGGGPIRIEGRFKNDEGELVRVARFRLGLPLTDKHAAVWLTVTK